MHKAPLKCRGVEMRKTGPYRQSACKDFHPWKMALVVGSGQTILLNDRSDRSKLLRSIINRKANLRSIICRFFIIVKWIGLLLWKQYIIITVRLGIPVWDNSFIIVRMIYMYQGLLLILDIITTVLWSYLYVYIVNDVKYDNLSTCFDYMIRSD